MPNAAPVCAPCGGAGEQCCPGEVCRDGGCCLGVSDALETRCVAQGGACASNGGTCNAGKCSGCGSSGQSCCNFYRCYGSGCSLGSCL